MQVLSRCVPEETARELFAEEMLRQVEAQGYEPAPGEQPVIHRQQKEPWQETIAGQDPDTGKWIGHPDDYGLRGTLRVVAKGLLPNS
jgi:hypothetical protein